MTVQQFIDFDIEPLAPTDTVGRAIGRLAELDVEHLPVVDAEGKLVALVSEPELLELPDAEAALGTIGGLGAVSVGPEVHVFEAATLMAAHGLSALPIAELGGDYLGLIGRTAVFEQFAADLSTSRPGTILVLDVVPRDYSLSQLSHLVEQSGGRVLSSTAQTPREAASDPASLLRVTLKLNVTDTARIRHVLEHQGYHIAAVYNEDETEDDISLRIQEFMRYLEV
jgi:CBS domain-containing protein